MHARAYIAAALFKSLSFIEFPYKKVKKISYFGLCKKISMAVSGTCVYIIIKFLS